MPRNISPAFLAALTGSSLYPVIMCMITLASGPVYLTSSYSPITWNGVTWTGVGTMLEISTIEDGANVQARGVSVSLSGINPVLLPQVLNDFQVGLPAIIYFAAANGEGNSLVDAPIVAWSGLTDQPTISVDQSTATIALALESLLISMNTPVPYRYTHVDQTRFYPGDMGMLWVNSIQSIPIFWGTNTTSDGNP